MAEAARRIRACRLLLVHAGAGMSVDSGIPAFRGQGGLWEDPANVRRTTPAGLVSSPVDAWAFYRELARRCADAAPHAGYGLIRAWVERLGCALFVATSNVDGHFQRAGVPDERVWEVHGRLTRRQCSTPCSEAIWDAPPDEPTVPRCPRCGALARPNLWMFIDPSWLPGASSHRQAAWFHEVERHAGAPITVLEIGAGPDIATIRTLSERTIEQCGATLVRVNPVHDEAPAGACALRLGGLAALTAIDRAL